MDLPVRLRVREVPLQWHEAAAIVRDVAEALSSGQIWSVPRAADLAIDREGAVHLLEPVGLRPLVSPDPAEVCGQLRRLLAEVLPREDAPYPLQQLASAESVLPTTTEEFCRQLAFFERPSRAKDLALLVGRLEADQEHRRLQSEVEAVTRKARADEEPSAGTPQKPTRPRRRAHVALVAALLALAIVLAAAALLGLGSRTGAAARVSTRQFASTGILATLRASARAVFGTAEASVPAPRENPDRSRPVRPRRVSKGASRRVTQPSSLPAPETLGSGQSAAYLGASEVVKVPMLPPMETFAEPAATIDSRTTVYDRQDADVSPAKLLRPHLPTRATAAPGRVPQSVLDVLIAEDGRVEEVRLLSTTLERRYYDAMLLPAVKAWIFQPASRGGKAVRYRLQIPLT